MKKENALRKILELPKKYFLRTRIILLFLLTSITPLAYGYIEVCGQCEDQPSVVGGGCKCDFWIYEDGYGWYHETFIGNMSYVWLNDSGPSGDVPCYGFP